MCDTGNTGDRRWLQRKGKRGQLLTCSVVAVGAVIGITISPSCRPTSHRQGRGAINGQALNSPKLIRFTELTEDEYFCTEDGAKAGITFENTSKTEPLVTLRYFGPGVWGD